MERIGEYLKGIREGLNMPLQEVYKYTNIDQTLLSRIENGRRLPTKEQVQLLIKLYGADEHKTLVLLGTEKVILSLKENEKYKVEIIESVKKQIDKKLNDNNSDIKYFDIENRRYIGNKSKLTKWIMNIINQHTGGFDSFFDVFAGTATVSKAAIPFAKKITMNDFLYSNNQIYKAFFQKEFYNIDKLHSIIKIYNEIDPSLLDDNYFSINFANKFFDYQNSKIIGYIREDIENRKNDLTNKEYSILIASLIYSIDKIANTVGHFDAYIKKEITYKKLEFRLIKPIDNDNIDIDIYREDANSIVRNIDADIVYIDPPYNSRQYSRFYHIYENLVTWEKPELFGVAMKPKAQNMSAYCTSNAYNTLKDLVENINARYIAISYNNTYSSKSGSSKNKITIDEIQTILENRGNTNIYSCSHKFFNTGKTNFNNHKELLFITKIER